MKAIDMTNKPVSIPVFIICVFMDKKI